MAEGPGGAGNASVEAEHDIEARAIPFLRHFWQWLAASDPRKDRTGDRLVLPADQHNAGKVDYLGNELGLLPKGVGDNRCQTKPCCERRDCFERALARVARGGFRVGCGRLAQRAGGNRRQRRPAPSIADQLLARCQPRKITRDFLSAEPSGVKLGPGQDLSGSPGVAE